MGVAERKTLEGAALTCMSCAGGVRKFVRRHTSSCPLPLACHAIISGAEPCQAMHVCTCQNASFTTSTSYSLFNYQGPPASCRPAWHPSSTSARGCGPPARAARVLRRPGRA